MSPKLPVYAVAKAKVDANKTQSPKEHLTHSLKPRHFPPSLKLAAVPTDKMLILN
jgi:hypothetical protein